MQYNLTADGSLVPTPDVLAGNGHPVHPAVTTRPGMPGLNMSMSRMSKQPRQMTMSRGPLEAGAASVPVSSAGTGIQKVGRNESCPCV
jgi:hypothetical protein